MELGEQKFKYSVTPCVCVCVCVCMQVLQFYLKKKQGLLHCRWFLYHLSHQGSPIDMDIGNGLTLVIDW